MRRRKLLGALVVLAVLVAAGIFVIWPRPDQITRANLDRIKKGMRRAEVEAILGGPPGDYRNGPIIHHIEASYAAHVHTDGSLTWEGDDGFGWISFDSSGSVMDCRFHASTRKHQTLLENVLWRAKRQWHRWLPEK
jgi:hypothetical protein